MAINSSIATEGREEAVEDKVLGKLDVGDVDEEAWATTSSVFEAGTVGEAGVLHPTYNTPAITRTTEVFRRLGRIGPE
jgi:hypothetical protein